MLIVSRTIRFKMKPQKITDKTQRGSVTTWYKTISWPFLWREIFNFPFVSLWKSYFLPQTNTGHLIPSVQKPNYWIDLKVSANCENLQRYRFASRVKVSLLQKNMDGKPQITANWHDLLHCMWKDTEEHCLWLTHFFLTLSSWFNIAFP